MGKTSWRGQIHRALTVINHIGEAADIARQVEARAPGNRVASINSYGVFNTVFDYAITYTNWLMEEYPDVRSFKDVDHEMTAEFLNEKSAANSPKIAQSLVAALWYLQAGLYAMKWIEGDLVPADWLVNDGQRQPRGPYTPTEAAVIWHRVNERAPEFGQALRFILSSGARINELLHLRADKVVSSTQHVELIGKNGKRRNIQVLESAALPKLDLSRPFVFRPEQKGRQWTDHLERHVRQACDELGFRRRGVHGFRATAACEFVDIKCAMGHSELEARRAVAAWLGHSPHRTEVTYGYVPKRPG